MANLPDPTSSYATAKLLTGVRNSQSNQPDHRRPITKQILQAILASVHPCTSTRYQQLMYSSMFTLMYHVCLRASEVILTESPQHILQISQLIPHHHNNSYELIFNTYKHSTTSSTNIHVMPTGTTDCPVTTLSKYLQVRGSTTGPLYIHKGSPITRPQFIKILHTCLEYAQIPSGNYNTHSFRIGRTTDMASANVPHSTIQKLGRWKSNAYLKYIRPETITTNP